MSTIIITATDFSAQSRAVADAAAELARRRGDDLVVAHVIDGPLIPGMPAAARLDAEVHRIASAHSCRTRAALETDGNVGKRLASLAQREGAALLVVGAQGEGMRTGIGTVATAALRHCWASALLVVRDPGRLWTRAGKLRAMVTLALDDTDATVSEALALLAATGDFDADFVHYRAFPDVHPERAQAKVLAERDVREKLSAAGVVPTGLHLGLVYAHDAGSAPERDVSELALTRKSDIVVCGSHHRRGLERVVEGSVAEQIVLHAPVSVLVARAPVSNDAAARAGFSLSPTAAAAAAVRPS